MPPPYSIKVLSRTESDDGIGGSASTWAEAGTLLGYIDLMTGTDLPTGSTDNAFIENSTHVAVIPDGGTVTDDDMLEGPDGKRYDVIYVDDPVGVGHHLEIYLRRGGSTNAIPG